MDKKTMKIKENAKDYSAIWLEQEKEQVAYDGYMQGSITQLEFGKSLTHDFLYKALNDGLISVNSISMDELLKQYDAYVTSIAIGS